jgi:RNA polymerase sigma factor (sigma-70 family)
MRTQLISDKELIRSYICGDENSIQILIRRHKDKIYTYIYLIIKDEHLAEDVFQDTFIKVIATLKRGKYNEEGKFLPWVMRIAHNLVIDHFRKKNKIPIADGGEDFDIMSTVRVTDPNVEDILVTEQIHDDLRRLVDLLPDEQKEVVRLRHYCGLSFKDIAEQTNVSINTALGRMRYALINLRKLMEDNHVILTRS